MYKERKEATYVEVGEEDIHHHIYIYISKISTMYVNMITRPVYKKKEVSTPPNKIKHISPLQRHVFLPLTCRILKRNHIFSPFLSWLTNGTKSYKASPEKHKDDQGGIRNPYKCMNVMKQDATDDKIIERCKICEKKCMQEGLDRLRSCWAAIE